MSLTWNSNQKRRVLASNFIIVAFMVYSVLHMFLAPKNNDALVANTIEALKFFTVESNIFVGIAALISFIYNKKDLNPKWVSILKYVATGTVTLTFFTVMVYLGPLIGYISLMQGTNLFMHLVTPVYAIFHWFFFEPKNEDLKFKHTFLSIVPSTLYGIVYMTNLAITGGYGTTENDWYAFGTFGLGIGMIVFAIMILMMYGLGVLLYFGHIKWFNKKAATK